MTERDYIKQAIQNFCENTSIEEDKIDILPNNDRDHRKFSLDINIKGIQFAGIYTSEIRSTASVNTLTRQIKALESTLDYPVILFAKYIAIETAKELKDRNINYIDIAGNAFLSNNNLFIYIQGQKNRTLYQAKEKLQPAAIKLIFILLAEPKKINTTYRELSELTGVSIGSITNTFKMLEAKGFIINNGKDKRLIKLANLLDQWSVAYNEVLKPKLKIKRLRHTKDLDINNLEQTPIAGYWGGEMGAFIQTKHLHPQHFTIYSDIPWTQLAITLSLIPDENGNFEIIKPFWKQNTFQNQSNSAPLLIIYADLIGSGFERNLKTAEIILKNELQYIQ